jgi:hypothetical protein
VVSADGESWAVLEKGSVAPAAAGCRAGCMDWREWMVEAKAFRVADWEARRAWRVERSLWGGDGDSKVVGRAVKRYGGVMD